MVIYAHRAGLDNGIIAVFGSLPIMALLVFWRFIRSDGPLLTVVTNKRILQVDGTSSILEIQLNDIGIVQAKGKHTLCICHKGATGWATDWLYRLVDTEAVARGIVGREAAAHYEFRNTFKLLMALLTSFIFSLLLTAIELTAMGRELSWATIVFVLGIWCVMFVILMHVQFSNGWVAFAEEIGDYIALRSRASITYLAKSKLPVINLEITSWRGNSYRVLSNGFGIEWLGTREFVDFLKRFVDIRLKNPSS